MLAMVPMETANAASTYAKPLDWKMVMELLIYIVLARVVSRTHRNVKMKADVLTIWETDMYTS